MSYESVGLPNLWGKGKSRKAPFRKCMDCEKWKTTLLFIGHFSELGVVQSSLERLQYLL